MQGPTAVDYMTTKLGVKSGDTVMVVDDQESYSTGLADIVGQSLTNGKGMKVDRESISQKATDFSSLIGEGRHLRRRSSTCRSSSPRRHSSSRSSCKAQGKTAIVFGSDGTFDSSKFNVNGSYISFFAPDVTTIPADAAVVAAFQKQFPGGTSPFGAPNYVLAQMYASAITKSCKDDEDHPGRASEELRQGVVSKSTILGTPIRFTSNGDLAGAKFHIFKIVNGKYTDRPVARDCRGARPLMRSRPFFCM